MTCLVTPILLSLLQSVMKLLPVGIGIGVHQIHSVQPHLICLGLPDVGQRQPLNEASQEIQAVEWKPQHLHRPVLLQDTLDGGIMAVEQLFEFRVEMADSG